VGRGQRCVQERRASLFLLPQFWRPENYRQNGALIRLLHRGAASNVPYT